MQRRHLISFRTLAPVALSLTAASLLAGCAANFTPSALQSDKVSIGGIQGTVHGGQSPISGAEIFLYATGTGGYGSAATSLISSTGPGVAQETLAPFNGAYYVTTDASGNFSLNGDYTCTAGQQVYIVAYSGNPGNPGQGRGGYNTTIMQMAGLGQCPSSGTMAQQVPYVVVNEISTVAFAYAMSGYGSSATNIGAPSTTEGQAGIANAMNNVFNILNIAYGQSPTAANFNSNGVVPQAEIYTLANILGACVNTTGPGPGNGNRNGCNTLFQYTTGTTTDEAQAIFYIAQHPTVNVTNLYNIQPAAPIFSPNLSSAPTDWTIPIVYQKAVSAFQIANNTTVGGPFNIAFDANGNAWIGDRINGVVKMSPQGAVTTYNLNFGMIKGVSVSPSGMIWAADYASNKVYIMDTSGSVNTVISSGLNGPDAIAFDANGNAYVSNEVGQSVSVYTSAGTLISGPTGFNNIGTPGFIAVDTSGNAWIPSTNSGYIGELTGQATASSYFSFASNSYAVVLDSSNKPWFGDYTNNQLDQVTSINFGFANTSSHTGGGLNGPYHLSFDGSGNIWVGNLGASVVSGWSTSSSAWLAANGFTTGTTGQNVAAVADISGNLCVANTDGSITQILGLATPTYAPVLPYKVATKP